MPQWTVQTITDSRSLRSVVEVVRTQKYALDDEEMQSGVRCIAASIFDRLGETNAALSITGPAVHVDGETIPMLTKQLRRAAMMISPQLGDEPES